MTLDLHSVLAWFLIGLLAWIGTQYLTGRGYGQGGDIGICILGALIGGFALSLLGLRDQLGLAISSAAAFGGAVLLTALARARLRRAPA